MLLKYIKICLDFVLEKNLEMALCFNSNLRKFIPHNPFRVLTSSWILWAVSKRRVVLAFEALTTVKRNATTLRLIVRRVYIQATST